MNSLWIGGVMLNTLVFRLRKLMGLQWVILVRTDGDVLVANGTPRVQHDVVKLLV